MTYANCTCGVFENTRGSVAVQGALHQKKLMETLLYLDSSGGPLLNDAVGPAGTVRSKPVLYNQAPEIQNQRDLRETYTTLVDYISALLDGLATLKLAEESNLAFFAMPEVI
ncbi:hypothetical protein N9V90_01675 [Endozoicomonas sp.]|nr:hypothetical protein [Endozoicomonas sp.]